MSVSVILIANPKGGSGKSTLATNLAGMLAVRGRAHGGIQVMLGDVDRQQCSRHWLSLRPAGAAPILGWDVGQGEAGERKARMPPGTTHAVLDTPAGLHGDKLKAVLRLATCVLVPVSASPFDIQASQGFLEQLAQMKSARGLAVALVGMRIDERTRAAEQFHTFADSLDLPLLTCLRDTQHYVQLAASGLTLFDQPSIRTAKDLTHWASIERWLFPY